jgi:hypothetical protein
VNLKAVVSGEQRDGRVQCCVVQDVGGHLAGSTGRASICEASNDEGLRNWVYITCWPITRRTAPGWAAPAGTRAPLVLG